MQTIGRAARNVNAKVILYADSVTDSMQRAIDETLRRRHLQEEYNQQHNITPVSIRKAIRRGIEAEAQAHQMANAAVGKTDETQYITDEYISELEAEMLAAAEQLEFERAAAIRDRIDALQDAVGQPLETVNVKGDAEKKVGVDVERARVGDMFPAQSASRAHAHHDSHDRTAAVSLAPGPRRVYWSSDPAGLLSEPAGWLSDPAWAAGGSACPPASGTASPPQPSDSDRRQRTTPRPQNVRIGTLHLWVIAGSPLEHGLMITAGHGGG